MKLNVSAAIVTVLLATSAQAERVIVIMKDKESFKTANQVYKAQGAYSLKGFKLGALSAGLNKVEARVMDSLENLNTLIVNTRDEAQFAKLKADPSVAYVEKEIFHAAPRPVRGQIYIPVINTWSSAPASVGQGQPWGILAVKAPEAWAASNQGQGARVMILDTGIDKNHVSLKGNFEAGKDFTFASTGDDFTDVVGHGTHVAGTIAGMMDSSGFSGVAPQAKVLMGRVCAPEGCSNISIAQGINWAISQKVDVISMSLGGSRSTPAERDSIIKADKAGITVVAASGNDGTATVSFPAALPTVIAVGAVDSNLAKADFSQWGKELAIVAPGVDVVSSVPTGTGREPSVQIDLGTAADRVKATFFQGAKELLNPEMNQLVAAGLGKVEDFVNVDVKGKYALVSRGEIAFSEKVTNALAAGATGVIIYNNAPGIISGTLGEGVTVPVGVFMIEQSVGQEILAQLAKGTAVKATVQVMVTDYASFQGTSMATPHVSGVVALMKAANHKLTGSQVKAILQRTATPLFPNDANQFGAGMINAEAAVKAALQMN